MAINKKYISPDSFKATLRDTFRKLMGQYWHVGVGDEISYGENLTKLAKNVKSITFTPQDLLGSSVLETDKKLHVVKLDTSVYEGADTDGDGFLEIPLPEEYGIVYEPNILGARGGSGRKVYVRVSADLHDGEPGSTGYQTLLKFSDDVSQIFQNPPEGFYFEESFEYDVPDSSDPIDAQPSLISDYNFFVEEYETASSTLQESILPNFYALSLYEYDTTYVGTAAASLNLPKQLTDHVLLYKYKEAGAGPSALEDAIRLNGVDYDITDVAAVNYIPDLNEYEYSLSIPYKDYLKEWTKAYTDLSFTDSSTLIELGKNIIQSYSSYANGIGTDGDKISDLNSRSKKMPFNIRLNMLAEGKSDIGDLEYIDSGLAYEEASNVADTIGKLNLSSMFISHTISAINPSTFSLSQEEENYEFNNKTYYDVSGNQLNLLASPVNHDLEAGTYASFNHLYWEALQTTGFPLETETLAVKSFDIGNKLFLDETTVDEVNYAITLAGDESDPEDYPIDVDMFFQLEKYSKALHYGTPNFEFELAREDANDADCRIYNGTFNRGDPAEDQTFAYRIKKYRGDSTVGAPVQDIWIPNAVAQGSPLEYIDTQVRYGEQYTYDISAYKYVFGMKYKYRQVTTPTIQQVESVFEVADDADVIGYNFRWFGARNLFDITSVPTADNLGPDFDFIGARVWELVANYANRYGMGSVPPRDTAYDYASPTAIAAGYDGGIGISDTFWAFNHFENRSNYPLPYNDADDSYTNLILFSAARDEAGLGVGDDLGVLDMTEWPAWGEENLQFFTLSQIRDVMRKAWYTRPTGLYNSAVEGGLILSTPSESVTYPNWYEMWGNLDWNDDWVTDNVSSGRANEITKILRGDINAFETDPSLFSLQDWFALFMGHDSGTPVRAGLEPMTGPGTPPQPMPPSHHRLNGFYLFGARDKDGDGDRDSGPNFSSSPIFISIPGYFGKFYSGIEPGGYRDPVADSYGVAGVPLGEGSPIYETTGFTVDYEIDMYPSTRVVEAPYATLTTAVLSKPPPPPEVEIIPYRAVNNQLLITFDATVAEREAVAVPISQEDEILFDKHYQAQGSTNGKIKFVSDDIPAHFEVFRLDRPPNTYADFDGSLRAKASTLLDSEDKIIRVRSTDYIEKLQPNIKYYYTFRTVDFHGNVSNPTFIYEVEVVDDGGAIYPLINTYDLPIIDNKVSHRTMKKIVQIYPALEQVTADLDINLETAEDINGDGIMERVLYQDPSDVGTVHLGNRPDAIWGKTFKVRLTSKKTGKKIDMNVTFDKKDERTKS
ncbi:MAG: hypothetical protein CMM25_08810 [Rhodospirillaceae bacterium]|nr:hypothetical protein [Rhodospirillaceae bacterium]